MHLQTDGNPYLMGGYAPIAEEQLYSDLEVIGEIPNDLYGLFVRTGPNPRFAPRGRHHWFDGDGMLHGMFFENGKATYRNRYISTHHFSMETEAEAALWSGLMEPIGANPKVAPYKNTANTDVVFHQGELLTMWYLSGGVCRVDPLTLGSEGMLERANAKRVRMAAHAKVDPRTSELLFFAFGMGPPFMHFGVRSPSGAITTWLPVPLPGPRLPHDMAFTEHFAILMDLPVFYNMEALKHQKFKTEFYPDMPSRFAFVHRQTNQIKWFETEPCYVYHTVNAWEEGDEVVLLGCRVDNPINPPRKEDGKYAQMLANLRLNARFYRWRFNLQTGEVHEAYLDDLNAEFPTMNLDALGMPSQWSYHMRIADRPTLLFDGIVKYHADKGAQALHVFGENRFGSEAPFAPRVGAEHEDDGYVISFVHDMAHNQTEVHIVDACGLGRAPVARVLLPQRVPIGFHATWVPGDCLDTRGETP